MSRARSAANDLAWAVGETLPLLRAVPDAAAGEPPGPGVWSPKEVIGHLIDSAAQNHQRFVRAQLADDLVFAGYEQARWVELQRYQDEPWERLLELWSSYNLHLAGVIARVPAEVRHRPRARHNLDEIAWRPVPRAEPATLDFFMTDYVGHLKHHLRQVFARLRLPEPPSIAEG